MRQFKRHSSIVVLLSLSSFITAFNTAGISTRARTTSSLLSSYSPSTKYQNSFGARSGQRLPSYHESLISSSALSSSSSSSSTKQTVPITSILNAALLISGTTIGGGFLALPTVTSTIGFIPSSITLIGVWLYFLFQSFVLVECIEYTREEELLKEVEAQGQEAMEAAVVLSSSSSPSSASPSTVPGVSTVARNIFGNSGQIIIGLLLTILIEATLVSQISRAGSMIFNGSNYKLGCAISSISIAILVFGPKTRGINFASKMNSALTIGFLLSTFGVFACGIPSANWDRLGFGATNIIMNLGGISHVIPTFLQLLVYGEIIPCVCEILNYDIKAIRLSIIVGSFLTLCLQICWSGLGMSLVSSTAGMISNDAVNVLLQQGGLVRFPLLSLAITAILTTILGSYLALLTMFNDLYLKLSSRGGMRNQNTDVNTDVDTEDMNNIDENSLEPESSTSPPPSTSVQQRLIVGSMITLPALSIACISPSVFLKAIDFAGSYPVLLLWGVLPPAMALIQRHRNRKGADNVSNTRISISSSGPTLWLILLLSISMGMVGMSAKNDLVSFISRISNHL